MEDNLHLQNKQSVIGDLANQSVWKNLRFQEFQRKGLHCDITLSTSFLTPTTPRAGVKAHKIILAEASPFFYKILTQKDFQNSSRNYNLPIKIEKLALEQLVNFIYNGKLSLLHENLLDIYRGSKLLELEEVIRKCEAFLEEGLNSQNVWQRFKLCQEMAPNNLPKIISYIQDSWDTVTSSAEFLELTYDELESIVPKESEKLCLSVFNSINAWVNYLEVPRKNKLVSLLKLIPLKKIPTDTLIEYLESRSRGGSPQFKKFANETLISLCRHQSVIINSSQQIPVKKCGFKTPVKQEELTTDEDGDDDVILLPTPPSQAISVKIRKLSNSGPLPTNEMSMCKQPPVKPSISNEGFPSESSSPYFPSLCRKRNKQQLKAPRKKLRTEILGKPTCNDSIFNFSTKTFNSCVNYFIKGSFNKPSLEHIYQSYAKNSRLFLVYNKESLATFDITLTPSFEVIASLIPESTRSNSVRHSSLVYYSNKVYNIGGLCNENKGAMVGVDSFDLVRKQWKTEANLVQARFNQTVIELKGFLYAIGGSSGKQGLASVERLDLRSVCPKWNNSEIKPMLYSREAHGSVAYDSKIYAIGGFSQAPDGSGICLDSMECYDSRKNQWTPTVSMRVARCGMALTVFNDKIYVIGGGNELNAKTKLKGVEVFNFKTGKWSNTKCLNHGRQYGSAVVLDGNLYVIGGDCESKPTVEMFVPSENKWELLPGVLNHQGSYRTIALKS